MSEDGPFRVFTAEEEVQGYYRLKDPLEREIMNLDSRNDVSAKGIKKWMLFQVSLLNLLLLRYTWQNRKEKNGLAMSVDMELWRWEERAGIDSTGTARAGAARNLTSNSPYYHLPHCKLHCPLHLLHKAYLL